MWMSKTVTAVVIGSMTFVPLVGCEDLPGTRTQQSTVIGGLGGAAAGALISDDNRLIGALIGGALGAGGGYLIGANTDWFESGDKEEAVAASRQAEANPATVDDVFDTRTADLNNDGFVTLDEVVAMENAGLSDYEILNRLEATNNVFELTNEQEQYLLDQGVSSYVVNEMRLINQDVRRQLLDQRQDIISD